MNKAMIYLNINTNKFNDISSRLKKAEDILKIEEMSFVRKGSALWAIREQELYLFSLLKEVAF